VALLSHVTERKWAAVAIVVCLVLTAAGLLGRRA